MSYILEALKRAEQERQTGQVPSPVTHKPLETTETASKLWPIVAVALLLVTIAVATFALRRLSENSATTLATPAVATPVVNQAATTPAAVPVARIQPSAELVKVIAVTQQPTVITVPEVKPAPVTQPEPAPEPAPEAVLTGPAQPVVVEDPALASDVDALATEPRPSWEPLPAAMRQQLGLSDLQFHRYSDVPEKRFVMIGGVRYGEGDRLPQGAVIEEVVESGVLLDWQGRRYLYDLSR